MSLLQLICFFLQRTAPDEVYVEEKDTIPMEPGYFFFDEDTGDIHSL